MQFAADGPAFAMKIIRTQPRIDKIDDAVSADIGEAVAIQKQTLVRGMPVNKTKRLEDIQEKRKDNDQSDKIDPSLPVR